MKNKFPSRITNIIKQSVEGSNEYFDLNKKRSSLKTPENTINYYVPRNISLEKPKTSGINYSKMMNKPVNRKDYLNNSFINSRNQKAEHIKYY